MIMRWGICGIYHGLRPNKPLHYAFKLVETSSEINHISHSILVTSLRYCKHNSAGY